MLMFIVSCCDDVHGHCGNGKADVGDLVAQGQVGQTSDASPGGRNDNGDYVVGNGIVDDHVDSGHEGQVQQPV